MKKNLLTQTLLSSALLAVAGGVQAAAFQLSEISTSGLGRSYAGEAAINDNAAVIATNPALMSYFKRPEFSLGAIYVDPTVNVKGPSPEFDHNNIAPNSPIPTVYALYPINDKFAVGGGVNVNYGLSTEYNNQYAGGFIGGKTELKSINFNLSGAYKLTNNISAGLGFNAVYADALIERYAGALSDRLGALKQPLGVTNSTLISKVEGDKWGYGWNAGLAYEINENNRLGLAYHSHVSIDFDGDYSNALPRSLSGPYASYDQTYQGALAQMGLVPTGGMVIPGSLKLVLPAYWEVSGYHKILDKLAFHYSWKYTEWSRFNDLEGIGGDGKRLFYKNEDFKNSSRLAIGTSYDITDKFIIRAGIAHDESAAENHHSLSIPDTNRFWYSLGATYHVTPNISVDAAFAHLRGAHNKFKENGIAFETKARVNLYGLTVNYRF